jgi:hypothetical protein
VSSRIPRPIEYGSAADFCDVLMTLVQLAIQSQTIDDPDKRPRLERRKARKFAWQFGTREYIITVEGPYQAT